MFLAGAISLQAQPAGGFGGFQMPKVDVHCSEKFADIDYAGDGQVYHQLDIYLPRMQKASYPVVVHIYGSAWYSNNSKGMADLGTIVNALLDAGYAVVTPEPPFLAGRQVPGPDPGHQGRDPLGAGQRAEIPPRSFLHRHVRLLFRRPPGLAGRDERRREGAGGRSGRQPRLQQPRECGRRLVRPRRSELHELRRRDRYLEPCAGGGGHGILLQGQRGALQGA